MCFTLYGVRVDTTGSVPRDVHTPLGWVSIQLFNHKGSVHEHLMSLSSGTLVLKACIKPQFMTAPVQVKILAFMADRTFSAICNE